MGKLYQIGSIIVRVYANDHLPYHFHIISPDFEVLVLIETLAVGEGTLPATARKQVMPWIEAHRTEIIAEWNRINPRFPIL